MFLTLVIGALITFFVAKAQDTEMRDNLITYAATIEKSIDWRSHAPILNTNPNQIKESDLAELETQLNRACKANRDCHFIYMLYRDKEDVKFLLDASPQPPSEISHLGEVFAEANAEIKDGLRTRKALVQGPVTDRWGTWVSALIPISITLTTSNFVMLGVDVAKRLTTLLRAEDTVARIGGDEFLVLLSSLKDKERLIATAEKVLIALAQPFQIANHALQLGASIGIALYPEHDDNPSNLIKFADDAMYVAKRQGRNSYALYQPD